MNVHFNEGLYRRFLGGLPIGRRVTVYGEDLIVRTR